uniref:WAP domain-containing protein n=1 Tax=Laticauda laticaudata TaxID=8630 RepID=A0A8C5SHV4_LATLA
MTGHSVQPFGRCPLALLHADLLGNQRVHISSCFAFPVKPGECPKVKIDPDYPCNQDCACDSECEGNKKCCPVGCARECFSPGEGKQSGRGTDTVDESGCTADEADEERKPTQSPGGTHSSTSLPEVAEKAGICPQAELERPNGNCTEECQSDAHCEGNQKCCQTGCGTSCWIPDARFAGCHHGVQELLIS